MRWISLFLLLPSIALAIPQTIHQEGFLTNAQGIPHEGPAQLRFSLYGAAEGGAALWVEEHNLNLSGGYYSVALGASTAFGAALDADPRFLGVAMDGAELLPRVQLSSVPYALMAEEVVGEISPRSVRVGGQQVIDEGGNWVGPAVPGANDGVGYNSPEEALAAIKAVDGVGSALDSDTLDGLSSAAFLQNEEQVIALLLGVDGAGSGLDADRLDGHDSSAFIRTAAQLIALLLTTDGADSGLDADRLDGHTSDEFLRSADPAIATKLLNLLLSVDGEGSTLDADLLDGHDSALFLQAADPGTAAEILNLLLSVDGAGSGLNADHLDGLHGSKFMRVDQNTGTSGDLSIGGALSGANAQFTGTLITNRIEADEIHAKVIRLIPLDAPPENAIEGSIYNSLDGIKVYNGVIWELLSGSARAAASVTVNGTVDLNQSSLTPGRAAPDSIAYRINPPQDGVNSFTRYRDSVAFNAGLSPGDEVILINLQGAPNDMADVGNYEVLMVSSVTAASIQFSTSITKSYDGANGDLQKVIIQRLPYWESLTVSAGGVLTASAWDGLAAIPCRTGILAFRSAGAVTIEAGGTIQVNGRGLRGGAGSASGNCKFAYNGEGVDQPDRLFEGAENSGGGEGGDRENSWCVDNSLGHAPSSGGGGSYGTAGAGGRDSSAGALYGDAELARLYLGSGGGGSSSYRHSSGSGSGGAGGHGGGIIWILAADIVNNGSVESRGNNGTNHITHGGGGGGGSGGSIHLASGQNSGSGNTNISGGTGGTGYASSPGGHGGSGRIKVGF